VKGVTHSQRPQLPATTSVKPATTSVKPTTLPVTPSPSTTSLPPVPKSQATLSTTSTQAPAWATSSYFADVAKKAALPAQAKTTTTPQQGNALAVRLGAAAAKKDVATPAAGVEGRRQQGRSLLQRVAHQAAVLGGHPLSAEDIERLGTTIHLTREASVAPILQTGLRPTKNPLANWSTWCRHAVYMFPAPPPQGSLEDKIVRRQGMTEVMQVDLRKLDPEKLYRRIMDGAIIYLSNTPIPTDAVTHLGSLPTSPP